MHTNENLPNLYLIWDFDAAIGQINSTYPYGYFEESIHEEIKNIKTILKYASLKNIPMIFAITGFAAEEGTFPFHIPDLIRNIHLDGHEIASHSWKHEWFPFLEIDQIIRTLEKSKMILEQCIGVKDEVKGFVPPFSRPMSWLKKGAFSLSDRAIGPTFKGNDIQKIIPLVKNSGYKWMRVSYRTIFEKMADLNKPRTLERDWHNESGLICLPNNYVGFDKNAIDIINLGIKRKRDIVISAHPSGLSRLGSENIENFKHFLDFIIKKRSEGLIKISLLSDV
jgi:hypothetical protein